MQKIKCLDPSKEVLVVDDFETMRRVLRNCLSQLGFQSVVEAKNESDAMQKLRSGEMQFIIADWNMPSMKSLEFVQMVRADPDFKSIPVLMLTADSEKQRVLDAKHVGVSSYITKPFTPESVQRDLRVVFEF